MAEVERTHCTRDCPDACGLVVDVEGGRARRVRGDPDHPYSRGTLCAKMNRYERSVHSPERLLHPLVRTGPKGAGEFRRASWDEAIALVAARWKEIVARDGSEAILPYSYAGSMGLVQRNAGMPLFNALGASRLDRTICSASQAAGWSAVMGSTPGPSPWARSGPGDPDDQAASGACVRRGGMLESPHQIACRRTAHGVAPEGPISAGP